MPPARSTIPLPPRRILVPTDFSGHAAEALRYAHELSRAFGAVLEVVHVIEQPTLPTFYKTAYAAAYGAPPDLEALAEQALDRLVEAVRATGLRAGAGCFVRRGHAADQILQAADEHSADLIVMGSHGLSRIRRLVLGSVAANVVQGAACPVLVVKAVGEQAADAAGGAQEGFAAASAASSSSAGRNVAASTMPAAK